MSSSPVHALPGPQKLTAEEVLRRSIDARRKVNVRGTERVIVQPPRGTFTASSRTVLRSNSGMTLTRWEGPNGAPGVVTLDDGTWTQRYDPKSKEILVSHSTGRVLDAASAAWVFRMIRRNYRVKLDGMAPMANRRCYVLDLKPYSPFSRSVKLWVDASNFCLLSHQESDAAGNTISATMYTGVEFPAKIAPSAFSSALPSSVTKKNFSRSQSVRDISLIKSQVEFEVCVPYAMPGGYEFEQAEVLTLNGRPAICLRYTDGMAEITICQAKGTEKRPAGHRAVQPMMDERGNALVDFADGPMNYMIVGRTDLNALVAITHALDENQERVYLDYLAKTFRVATGTLISLRNQGLGADTIDAMLLINRQTRKPLQSLIALCRQGYGWPGIARMFKADLKVISRHIQSFQCR